MVVKTTLTSRAAEESTFIVTAAFKDENGVAVVPNAGTVTWTLIDTSTGDIINNRENVAITSASTINIVLSGSDLSLVSQSNSEEERRLTIQAEYDSVLANDLPIKGVAIFMVVDILSIS